MIFINIKMLKMNNNKLLNTINEICIQKKCPFFKINIGVKP